MKETAVDIGECRLDGDEDIAIEAAWSWLSTEERARAAEFVFERDRCRFVRARGYLRSRLGARLGLSPRDVPIAIGADGKPFVEGYDLSFNLSHSGAHAVLAISAAGAVGIDLEVEDRADGLGSQIDGLADLCMTGEEQAALAAASPERRVQRFLSYWTAKEARMKLSGEGFALDPLQISLELSKGRPVGYRRPRGRRADLRFVPLSRPDAVCCVAVWRGGCAADASVAG